MNDKKHQPVTCPNDGCDLSGILNFELNAGEDYCPMCKSVLVAADDDEAVDSAESHQTTPYKVH